MLVSVLIPVFNEQEALAKALAAATAQTTEGFEIEFLLIDGRSTDQSRLIITKAAASDPRIKLLDNPHRTIPHALNAGLHASKGTYVARMDAHSIFPPDYLKIGVEQLIKSDLDWIVGPQIPVGFNNWSRATAIALDSKFGSGNSNRWQSNSYAQDNKVQTSVFCGIFRRTALTNLGGWDESWLVNEDSELAARFHQAGYKIGFNHDLAAKYFPRASLSHLWKQYFRYGHFRAKTTIKHPSTMRLQSLAPVVVTATVPVSVVPSRMKPIANSLLTVYLAAVFGWALTIKRPIDNDPGIRWQVAAAAICMHVGWGAGFITGLIRWLLISRPVSD